MGVVARYCLLIAMICLLPAVPAAGQTPATPSLADEFKEARAECDKGMAISCTFAGLAFELGKGVAKDVKAAVPFYVRACDGNNGNGCLMLGHHYGDGAVVPADQVKAATLYKKGCDLKEQAACRYYAARLWDGSGVKQDRTASNLLMEAACEGKDWPACLARGARFYTGATGQDYGQAQKYFQKACDGGVAQGCGFIGTMFGEGIGVTPDLARAAGYFRTGCDGKDPLSCTYLGSYMVNGLGGVPQEVFRAQSLLDPYCTAGYLAACVELAVAFERRDGLQDVADAVRYRAKGCRIDPRECSKPSGAKSAPPVASRATATTDQLLDACRSYEDRQKAAVNCLTLGKAQALGSNGVAKNYASAFWLVSRACDFGAAEGCLFTAALFQLGLGLPDKSTPDPAGAKAYVQIACQRDKTLCDGKALAAAVKGIP